MQLTVSKYLNARKEKPAASAFCPFYRSPGETILINKVVIGEKLDGNSIWYYAPSDNCYYWSGGFLETEFSLPEAEILLQEKEYITLMAEAQVYFLSRYLLYDKNITGISVADKRVGTAGDTKKGHFLVFQVEKKTVRPVITIPPVLYYKGCIINTDIVEAGFASFQSAFFLGESLSRKNETEWGTCGLKVEGTEWFNQGTFILTNYHVAAFDLLRNQIYDYWVEGEKKLKECVMPSWISERKRSVSIGHLFQGSFLGGRDIALIKLDDPGAVLSATDANGYVRECIDIFNDPSFKGWELTLFGAASKRRTGTIISVNAQQRFSLNDRVYLKEGLIQLTRISQSGDSGALLLLGDKVAGLLIGADEHYSYMMPVQSILNEFKLKLSQ